MAEGVTKEKPKKISQEGIERSVTPLGGKGSLSSLYKAKAMTRRRRGVGFDKKLKIYIMCSCYV